METPGVGQVRALVTHGGNPVLSTPNGARLDRALAGLEFFVAIDFYVNETTRHANLILPPTSPLEREHYDLVFHTLAVRNTAKWSSAVFERSDDARHDWEIINALVAGLTDTVGARVRAATIRTFGPSRMVDLLIRQGPHGSGWNPFGSGLTLAKVRRAAHGLDLGALQPVLPGRLRTADRRIHAAPAQFVDDIARLEARWAQRSTDHLSLIGRRDLRSCNSWMHNYDRLVRGKARCTLLMHPSDAAARGLTDGATVRVTSRVGDVEVPLECTDAMMPGVVSIPHGWGHGGAGTRTAVAAQHAGASINDLTDEARIDALTGNAAFSGVDVTVERCPA
jgi:anaerobic selenocysteine-containing dehydrogenase